MVTPHRQRPIELPAPVPDINEQIVQAEQEHYEADRRRKECQRVLIADEELRRVRRHVWQTSLRFLASTHFNSYAKSLAPHSTVTRSDPIRSGEISLDVSLSVNSWTAPPVRAATIRSEA